MKEYGYARVSTTAQDLAIQMAVLKDYGLSDADIYCDKKSGKNMDREELKRLLEQVQEGDMIVLHKLDRLGRSVSQITTLISELTEKGIYIKTLEGNIDTSKKNDVTTLIMITIFSLLAEMERTFILERTQAGLEKAKANGVQLGRKEKHNKWYELAIKDYLEGKGTVKEVLSRYSEWDKDKEKWIVKLTDQTFYRKLREYKALQGIS